MTVSSEAAAQSELILVGAGARARAWAAAASAMGMRIVALVARHPSASLPGLELPPLPSLVEALARFPSARVAVALPPRAGLEAALALAEAGRRAIVEAPLDRALAELDPIANAAEVRVAHGFVTLPGRRWLEQVASTQRLRQITVEAHGLPEEDGGDAGEVLVHALALLRRLAPGAVPRAARQPDGSAMEVDLTTQAGLAVRLRALAHGRTLRVQLDGDALRATWLWHPDVEEVQIAGARGTPTLRPRAVPAAEARALAQLGSVEASAGDDLAAARETLRLAESVRARLPVGLPVGRRRFEQAARLLRERPNELLPRLGLAGFLPPGPRVPSLSLRLPTEPFELWPFRAGIKPVAFLTVRPAKEAETVAAFGEGVHVERRERKVQVDAQDRWTDRRDVGQPFVELYLSRDPELAKRAAKLQAESDPSKALRDLGVLMGYPPCCVAAFARQDDRANNSRNRYATRARTPDGDSPWPWELNNLHASIVPFYPCSYRCNAAITWARAVLRELEAAHPELTEPLRRALAKPVLYFDHDHQLVFDGALAGGELRYREVLAPDHVGHACSTFGGVLSFGDRLAFDDRSLRVFGRDAERIALRRTDPALGFLAPFGVTES